MKNLLKNLWVFIFVLILAIGCEGDEEDFTLDGTDIKMSELVGNWNAITLYFGKAGAGPVTEVELIGEGGSASLSVQSNGRFSISITPFGESTETSTGQLQFDEDLLVVTYDEFPEDWEYFTIQLVNNQLFLSGPGEYDFNDDGVEEEAYLSLVLEK